MLASEVLSFIEENDVKFIRMAFLDLFGRLKNIAILPSQLQRAFDTGIPLDATAVDGFEDATGGELLLRPDPSTLCILPWRPQAGRVCRLLCDVVTPSGASFEKDPRAILQEVNKQAAQAGLTVRIGTECEFYLFELDEHGQITGRTQDRAGYLDVAPFDRGEDVRRDICLTLEAMDIRPESSHHERGPGQNEVDFHRADPLTAADHLLAFHNAVRTVAARYGLRASFLPKPIPDSFGNGMGINLSLYRGKKNLMRMDGGELSSEAKSAMAGVLNRLPAMSIFLNTLPNSYDRLSDLGAPRRLCWSTARDESALRVPVPQDRFARMQIRSADPACNAYLAFALITKAALEGIEKGESLEDCKRAGAGGADCLPENMADAIALAKNDAFLERTLAKSVIDSYLGHAQRLLDDHLRDTQGLFKRLFESF